MYSKRQITVVTSSTSEDSVFIEQNMNIQSSSIVQQNGNNTVNTESYINIQRQRRTSDVIDSLGTTPPPSPLSKSPMVDSGGGFQSRKRTSTSGSEEISPLDTGYESLLDSCDSGKKVEMLDANPCGAEYSSSVEVAEVEMVVEKDDLEYNMNHSRRGRAIIFNHDTFDGEEEERKGSEVDVQNLESTFQFLGFEVTVCHNMTYSDIMSLIDTLAKEDHSDADCLVITVLTHGQTGGVIHAKDCLYKVERLWTPFTADQCLTLAGKPKIFFVQACRGKELDPGVRVRRRTETDSGAYAYKIPREADFLVAYSSSEGYYSWRNPEKGTWFIQVLCEELRSTAATTDLLRLLTRTSRRVALDFQSYHDIYPWMHEQKQIPTVMSKLIREVYFRPK